MPQMPIEPPPSFKAAGPLRPLASAAPQAAQRGPWAARLISALLLFWLLREWLVPLERLSDITEVNRITPFLIAFGFFLALDVLRVPGAAGWPLKIVVILGAAAVLHSGQWIPGWSWWAGWATDLSGDALDAIQGKFSELEPVTRTMLFLAGWSFFIWVVHSFAAERQQLGWFVLMTLFYLVLLQLIFDMDMSYGLLSASGAGLLLQGSLQAERWLNWKYEPSEHDCMPVIARSLLLKSGVLQNTAENTASRLFIPNGQGQPAIKRRWPVSRPEPTVKPYTGTAASIAAGFAVTGLCLLGAWIGAGQHPQQSKPVDWSGYLQSWEQVFPSWNIASFSGEGGRAARQAQTGYSTDDSKLGSPLQTDDRIAFTARTTQLTYWRGEAKNIYTGQGWTQTYSQHVQNSSDSVLTAGVADAKSQSPAIVITKIPVHQEVTLKQTGLDRQLFLGGDLVKVDAMVSQKGEPVSSEWLWRNKLTGRVLLPVMSDPLSSYRVQVLAWNRSTLVLDSAEAYTFLHNIGPDFLQLPDNLPARVTELAKHITAGFSSPYEKVKAVEQHLQNGYAYSLEQSRPPAAGKDLVDQFLFESKIGYCDHFSSAMVVMLRSIGIPSRWVKGFAPGEVTGVETVNPNSDSKALQQAAAGGAEQQRTLVGETAETAGYFNLASSVEPVSVYTVEVRNMDAHSWVEVYFPTVGWVPFDPTPGFNAAGMQPNHQASDSASAPAGASGHAPADQNASEAASLFHQVVSAIELVIPKLRKLTGLLPADAAELSSLVHSIGLWMMSWLPLSLWITAALTMPLLIHMWIRRMLNRTGPNSASFRELNKPVKDNAGMTRTGSFRVWTAVRLSERIWSKLQRRMGAAGPAQTLREYMLTRSCVNDGQRGALLRLVQLLEAIRYHNLPQRVTLSQLHTAWRELRKSSNDLR